MSTQMIVRIEPELKAKVNSLANLSLRLGRRIRWDAETEQIVGDPAAAQMLVRPYRKPWDAELRSLNVS